MIRFRNQSALAIGEAMVELAPVGNGLYAKGFAGDTFNTAWHMAQLLGPQAPVGYITRVGQDAISQGFVDELAADGVQTTGISRDPARTMGLYLIELNGVERSFHYWRSASAAKGLADDAGTLAQAIGQAGLIHLSGITLAILSPEARANLFAVLADARGQGAVVSFDPNIRLRLWSGMPEIRQTVETMLALTDIALPSFDDEALVWGDATPAETIARMAGFGVAEVAVKDGAGIVNYRSKTGSGAVPTPPVDGICDTTGAGDAFNAGYLAARLSGHAPDRAIATGQALSALVIRTFGARANRDQARALATLLD